MARKKMNKDYGYTTRKQTEAIQAQKKEEMKAYRRQMRLSLVLGFILLAVTFCLAMINLSEPNKTVDILSYFTMSVSMFLFMYHYREINKKFSTVSMVIGLISTVCLIFLLINYTPEISMMGGLFSKSE